MFKEKEVIVKLSVEANEVYEELNRIVGEEKIIFYKINWIYLEQILRQCSRQYFHLQDRKNIFIDNQE